MRLLLDTCAVLFVADDTSDLTVAAYEAIQAPDTEILVSAVTPMELACLQERGRIRLSMHWRRWWHRLLENTGWICLPITGAIAEEAFCLPEPLHRDPADRLLIASARLERLTLVTADRLILNYPHVASMH